ncbi:MAG: dephospho-CoA kinase [Planctomycetes bacterium]|nr:dephospho-CoA kinase [Planctomycetota bacterium]
MALGRVTIVGLVGGIGSGKSTVAGFFAEEGAHVIDADELAHQALRQVATRRSVVEAFGQGVLGTDGEVDRRRLAAQVFGDGARVARLNGIVHPAVRAEVRRRLEAHDAEGGGVAVLDVPLLLEGPLASLCDHVVFVDAPRAERAARVRSGRGWDEAELERREAHQTPLERKRVQADWVVANGGEREEARRQVRELWRAHLARGRGANEARGTGPSEEG